MPPAATAGEAGAAPAPLELWGGVESTVARIGDRFRDQSLETGHRDRIADLDRIAALGVRTLRYPVIWETIAPERPGLSDFTWHDARLAHLRALGIRPIVGLVHHGSGPRYTSLLDRDFPRLLARHAARVARRYPWIEHFTPVNEPLTTARFSCLYGHWYPHARDTGAFLRALVAQCRATVLAMRAIRRVTPGAKLVGTEDFGRVFSSPSLGYQAYHENERRWLSYDLLFGRVDRRNEWWGILREHGVPERDLQLFLGGEGRPDIVGINHYLTSDRYVDERVESFPAHLAGGNAFTAYADVEAVRMPVSSAELGPAARLREVWDRYRAPIAVTEAHHGCTRDEQLRWLAEVWAAAETVRREGADIRAVTAWSLLGTVDWNSLLTREAGIYEPGAFDIRGPAPRPTALAGAVAGLARDGRFDHPALDVPGWWHRPERFYAGHAPDTPSAPAVKGAAPRSMLVLGPDSSTRRALMLIAARRGLACHVAGDGAVGRQAATRAIQTGAVWAVLDLGLLADRASSRPATGGWNREELAAACARAGRRYVVLSDANLFGGALGRPALEDDAPSPPDEPSRETSRTESRILGACPSALAIRTGPVFGPWDRDGLVAPLRRTLALNRPVAASAVPASPTYLPDLVHVLLDLLIDGESGIRHLVSGSATGHELAALLAERLGVPAPPVSPGTTVPAGGLATAKGVLMPPLPSALDRYLADCVFDWTVETDEPFGIAAE